MGTSPGWYPDPSHRYPLRFWDGFTWTDRALREGREYRDSMPPPPPPSSYLSSSGLGAPPDRRRLTGQLASYLDSAFDRGLLDPSTHDRLRADVVLWAEATPTATPPLVHPVPVPLTRQLY